MAQMPGHRYLSRMQNWLPLALYVVIGILFLVLAAGVVNLVRTDDKARSRSNQLMRLRVAVQFVAVLIIVAIGFAAGAFAKH
jgi:type IV secretory pathway VirB2 component (pilin)